MSTEASKASSSYTMHQKYINLLRNLGIEDSSFSLDPTQWPALIEKARQNPYCDNMRLPASTLKKQLGLDILLELVRPEFLTLRLLPMALIPPRFGELGEGRRPANFRDRYPHILTAPPVNSPSDVIRPPAGRRPKVHESLLGLLKCADKEVENVLPKLSKQPSERLYMATPETRARVVELVGKAELCLLSAAMGAHVVPEAWLLVDHHNTIEGGVIVSPNFLEALPNDILNLIMSMVAGSTATVSPAPSSFEITTAIGSGVTQYQRQSYLAACLATNEARLRAGRNYMRSLRCVCKGFRDHPVLKLFVPRLRFNCGALFFAMPPPETSGKKRKAAEAMEAAEAMTDMAAGMARVATHVISKRKRAVFEGYFGLDNRIRWPLGLLPKFSLVDGIRLKVRVEERAEGSGADWVDVTSEFSAHHQMAAPPQKAKPTQWSQFVLRNGLPSPVAVFMDMPERLQRNRGNRVFRFVVEPAELCEPSGRPWPPCFRWTSPVFRSVVRWQGTDHRASHNRWMSLGYDRPSTGAEYNAPGLAELLERNYAMQKAAFLPQNASEPTPPRQTKVDKGAEFCAIRGDAEWNKLNLPRPLLQSDYVRLDDGLYVKAPQKISPDDMWWRRHQAIANIQDRIRGGDAGTCVLPQTRSMLVKVAQAYVATLLMYEGQQ